MTTPISSSIDPTSSATRLRATPNVAAPGLRLVVFAIYVNCIILCRPVLYFGGLSLPDAYFGVYGSLLTIILIAAGMFKYLEYGSINQLCSRQYKNKITLWFLAIILLGIYGILLGNDWNLIYRETFLCVEMGVFLLLGIDDRFWYGLDKHITCAFYLGVALILIYYQVPIPEFYGLHMNTLLEPGEPIVNFRSTNSTAVLLRPLLGPGVLIGMWGLVRRDGGVWRIAQIAALPAFFACEVGIFKYRSEAIFAALAVASFLLLRPMLEKRLRPTMSVILLSVVLLGLAYYVSTESYQLLERRQEESVNGMDYRFDELDALRADLGWQILVGRGLGGTFDASAVRAGEEGADKWMTVHFGLVVLMLKGGIPFLVMFLSFIVPGISIRARSWYANPINLTAALLLPIYILWFIVDPIALTPDAVLLILPPMMLLARFGTRQTLDNGSSELHESHM
jgi:hypothetical protein